MDDNGDCIDKMFLQTLKHAARNIYIRVMSSSKEEVEDLVKLAKETFGKRAALDPIEKEEIKKKFFTTIELSAKKLDVENAQHVDVLKKLVEKCDEDGGFSVYCGEDFGSDYADAIQVATILECRYKPLTVEEEDHFEYSSIRGTSLDV